MSTQLSHLNNPHRLPRAVTPQLYTLRLSPDLHSATFTGSVSIDVTVHSSVECIVMNAKELTITSVHVDGAEVGWSLHEATERLIIDRAHDAGDTTIDITFSGVLNDKLRGFYRSTYIDDAGEEQVIATTQMQSTDCRRAFPCFDEPDFKAVFRVSLEVDEGLLAISNGAEINRTHLGDGRTLVLFADTMAMSTYLVAFIVGMLEATEPVMVNGTPLRIIHIPGKAHLTDFGLSVGAYCLEWFERYYAIPYPSDKVDMIALPDFAAGAMENLGCITFREVLLLVDPATSTQVERELVADVVAHELAHMWFGDLVTMKWWNGIWLNEAFATFMEVAACDAFAPQWKRWVSFGLERSVAFETDSLHSTRPIEFEVQSPDDSEGMFDVLTYQKGGAVLRMLEQYLGEERFRRGVNRYLTTHSYGNTETSDLWDAIEASVANDDDGENVPVRRLMDSWIWQAGYPLISARVADGHLVLDQRRFSFDDEPDATTWLVPIHVRIGDTLHKLLLQDEPTRLPVPHTSTPILVNAGGSGFFRVTYSEDLLERLTGDAFSRLDVLERYNLVDDAWNAVIAGHLPAIRFVDMCRQWRGERELAVWQAMIAGLRFVNRLLPEEHGSLLAAHVVEIVTPCLHDLGWEPRARESDLDAKLRGLVVSTLAVLGRDADAQRRCRDIFNRSANEDLDPELVASATSVVAAIGDTTDYEAFLARFREPSTPQEQIRMLYALADFDSEELVIRSCELAFSGEVKTQNAPFLLNRCIANKNHGEVAWRHVRQHWDAANETFPVNTIIRMVDSVRLLMSDVAEADVQAFFGEHDIPQAVLTLQQVLERQRVNSSLRRREADRLVSDLSR
ncbi:MAG: M1 family metallopeptidase [Actinomycetota bacterium]